jgi:hypothetical protein
MPDGAGCLAMLPATLQLLIVELASRTSPKGKSGKVVCRSRLGGTLNFYHREAA